MAENQQQNGPAAFGKIKKFDNGGRVIQWAMNVEDLKKFIVRKWKVYFKMTELKEETQYGAKYLIREDDYMANYNNEWEGPLGSQLEWETSTGPTKMEKTWEVISAWKDTWLKPWDVYKDWKVIKKEDRVGPSADPAPSVNVDDLFA